MANNKYSPSFPFNYARHLDIALSYDKIEFYRTHPELWKKRYRTLPVSALREQTNGFVNGVNILQWIEGIISNLQNQVPQQTIATWDKVREAVGISLDIQSEALFSTTPGFIPNQFSQKLEEFANSTPIIHAYRKKAIALHVHKIIQDISVQNLYPAEHKGLPMITLFTDMVYFPTFDERGLIVPYTFLLSVLDKIESQFAYTVYIGLANSSDLKQGLQYADLADVVNSTLHQAHDELGTQAADVSKLMEPLCVGVCLETFNPETNSVDFLDETLESVRNEKPHAFPFVHVLATHMRAYLERHGESGIPSILEQYGHEKLHYYPIIDQEGGLIKMYRFGTAALQVNYQEAKELAGHFVRDYIISYYNKEGHLPSMIHQPDLHSRIKRIIRTGNPQSLKYCMSVPAMEWTKIVFRPHHIFNYYGETMDLLDDKAITPHLNSINQLFARDALWVINKVPPTQFENTKLVLEILSRPVIDIREFYQKVESIGYFPPNWAAIQLMAKERELKIEARVFSILTFEARMMCSACEKNLSDTILPYFQQQTMTDTGPELRSRVDKFISVNLSPEETKVMIHLDLEQWNYTFRQTLQLPFTEVLNNIFGVEHFHTVTKLFSESFLFSSNKFTPPGTPGVFTHWTGHAGGNQGIFQKLWTLITITIIRKVMHENNLEHNLIGSGDNQVILLKLRQRPQIKQYIEGIIAKLKHAFQVVGLSLKDTETWYSSELFAYQRKYYYKGGQCEGGIKQVVRAYAGGSDITAGQSNSVSTAMNGGTTIAESTSDPLIGPIFAYLEALSVLILDPTINTILPLHPQFLVLLPMMNVDLGYYPFVQLSGFLYSGHKDNLTESLAIHRFIWDNYPEYKLALSSMMAWKRGSEEPESVAQCISDPQTLNVVKPQSPESVLKGLVETYLSSPGTVTNQHIHSLITYATTIDKGSFLATLLAIRPINTSLMNGLLESSHIGQVMHMVNRFNRISSLLQVVSRHHAQTTLKSFQATVVSLDRRQAAWVARKFKVIGSIEGTWFSQMTAPATNEYMYFCGLHNLHPDCSFSVRLFLTSWTYYQYPQLVMGPYLPAPSEQVVFHTAPKKELLHCSILISPASNIPRSRSTAGKKRGPYGLLIGSKTENPAKTIRLVALQGLDAGSAIRNLLKLLSWFWSLQVDPILIKMVMDQISLRSPALTPYLDDLVGGTAGGSFIHRYDVPGQVMGAYINSASTLSSWIQLSTNGATSLQRGEENRFIFFQANFQPIIAGLRLSNVPRSKFLAELRLDHCSYVVPEQQFQLPLYNPSSSQTALPALVLGPEVEKALTIEAQHYTAVKALQQGECRDGVLLLAGCIGLEFALTLRKYQLGQTEVDEHVGKYFQPQSVYNITVIRKVPVQLLLQSCALHAVFLGCIRSNRSPLWSIKQFLAMSKKPTGVQDIAPYKTLIEALVTGGHLSSLVRYTNKPYNWASHTSPISFLPMILAGLGKALGEILMRRPRVVLILEAIRPNYSWDPVWKFLSHFSRSFKSWLRRHPHSSTKGSLTSYLSHHFYVTPVITTDKGLILQQGRQLLAGQSLGPCVQICPTKFTAPTVNLISSGVPMLIGEKQDGEVDSTPSDLIATLLNLVNLCRGSDLGLINKISRWHTVSSGAKLKLADLLTWFIHNFSGTGYCVTLAEGAGSFLSFLLHWQPSWTGIYYSLLPPEILPHSMSAHFIPPECICPCCIEDRVVYDHSLAQKYGDLSQVETWNDLATITRNQKYQPQILTCDMEGFRDDREAVFSHLFNHLNGTRYKGVIIKLYIQDALSPIWVTVRWICSLYNRAAFIKPAASALSNSEFYLVLEHRCLPTQLGTTPSLVSMLIHWTLDLQSVQFTELMDRQLHLAQWWGDQHICPSYYPSTLSCEAPVAHPLLVSLSNINTILITLIISNLDQESYIGKSTLHMIQSQSKGAKSTDNEFFCVIAACIVYLKCMGFSGLSPSHSPQAISITQVDEKTVYEFRELLQEIQPEGNRTRLLHLLGEFFSSRQSIDDTRLVNQLWVLIWALGQVPQDWALRRFETHLPTWAIKIAVKREFSVAAFTDLLHNVPTVRENWGKAVSTLQSIFGIPDWSLHTTDPSIRDWLILWTQGLILDSGSSKTLYVHANYSEDLPLLTMAHMYAAIIWHKGHDGPVPRYFTSEETIRFKLKGEWYGFTILSKN
nr:MAG: RNA-dependent RNA polymerase [Wufeng shrew peropuvirus 2]